MTNFLTIVVEFVECVVFRYALYLEDLGKRSETIEVLKQLISIKDKLDQETYVAVVDALESMQQYPATSGTV